MTNLEVFLLIAVLLILIGGGVILYLALARSEEHTSELQSHA